MPKLKITAPNKYNRPAAETSGRYSRTLFREQTAILHSLAFRRLKHKTQVFFSPENDHICTASNIPCTWQLSRDDLSGAEIDDDLATAMDSVTTLGTRLLVMPVKSGWLKCFRAALFMKPIVCVWSINSRITVRDST
jgi:hypothetical protein